MKVKWICDLFCLKVPYKCIIDHKRKQSFLPGPLKAPLKLLKILSSYFVTSQTLMCCHSCWCQHWQNIQMSVTWVSETRSMRSPVGVCASKSLLFRFFVCLPISLQLVYSLDAKGVSKSVQITVTVKHPGFDSEGLKTSKIKSKFSHTVNLLRCIPLSFPCLMRHFLWKSG